MKNALENYHHYYQQAFESFSSKQYKASSTYFDMCHQILSQDLLCQENICHDNLNKYFELSELVSKFAGEVFCKKCVIDRLNAFYINLLNIYRSKEHHHQLRLAAGIYLNKVNDKLIAFYQENKWQVRLLKQKAYHRKVYRNLILVEQL